MIFGTGSIAECAHFYFTHDSPHDVVAFTVHGENIQQDRFAGLPVVPFEEVVERHPPDAHEMFVAIGYRRVNQDRAAVFGDAKEKGYALATYVSSKATHWGDTAIGENTFVFEDNTIQPFVTIGDDTILWSGNHIGHHVKIGSHCFITSHVVVSGHVTISDYSFLGVNATLRDNISIGRSCVIGSGAVIMRDTDDSEVYPQPRTKPSDRRSDEISM